MPDAPSLRLHRFLPASRANGPGLRVVLWTQGCSLGCPGCFNPETHARSGGETLHVDEVAERILALAPGIEGITVSGGEPLQQFRAVLALLQLLRARSSLSVILFTGYRAEEVRRMPRSTELLSALDVLIAGRYDAPQRVARDLRGSANKSIEFLTSRYAPVDFEQVPEAEVVISPDGEVLLSGIDPLKW